METVDMQRKVDNVDLNRETKEKFLMFDGAMGTMLQKEGLKGGELPESYNILYPEIIYKIHKEYIDAGADIITTNTFGANRLKLKDSEYSISQIISEGVKIAKKAADDKFVALDIGPTGQMMEPIGNLTFDEAYEIFKEQIIAGEAAGVDIVLIETFIDLYESRAAILAAKENSNLPIICTMTFEANGRTLTGTDPITMVQVLEGLGVNGIGINCSLGPKELKPIVEEILKYASIPVIVQPNAGLPELKNGNTVYDLTPEDFAKEIEDMATKGVAIFGGCCGTNPDFVKEVKKKLNKLKPLKLNNKKFTCACSARETVTIGNEVKVIGERINPTGKKRLKEALKKQDLDYVISEAITQKNTGANILDVNMGVPGIDEREMMVKAIKELQGIVDIPLQVDSTKAEVIEAAVRVYNGKPIINSVNGKTSSMEKIFPIVKKYGACVIGLTLDEEGIPKTAEKRFEIAAKIINTAKEYGIPEENILIDCLVLTASAEQPAVMETLKAIPLIKDKYNVKTVLGASNVSFGLPNRQLINSTYLAMALTQGLDAPITDSTASEIMDTIRAFKVLSNQDMECIDYINYYGKEKKEEKLVVTKSEGDLKDIVLAGMKDEAALKTKELLQSISPMEIVDSYLIPALDLVGLKYEKGEIFLPQLIRSAETVKIAFNNLKEYLLQKGEKEISKGKILLATVKGDIHDIGKNIVKILLENYGFEVIDLGKDISPEEILRIIKEKDIDLVGLSALMTTTVESMKITIEEIKRNNLSCGIMVGGAVLNSEYAKEIGADYYGKDANEAVEIAKEYFRV